MRSKRRATATPKRVARDACTAPPVRVFVPGFVEIPGIRAGLSSVPARAMTGVCCAPVTATDPRLDNEARYDRMARYYAPLMRVMFLGQASRLYRAVAGALEVPAGGSVVELGCGPGTATEHIRAALDPATQITGVDLSGEMLVHARRRAERERWTNVRFELGSALTWQPLQPVDAVAISLALTVFPEPMRCLDHALSWLRPGGQLVVLDSFLIAGRRFANWVVRAKAGSVGAVPEDVSFELLLSRLDAPRVASLFGGSYTLVTGRVPRA